MFRLRQKHSRNLDRQEAPVRAEKLIAAQSVSAAIGSAVLVIIVFSALWVYTASVSGRYFPWLSVVQGAVIGIAVRRCGLGLDWRFPVIAGAAAWLGAFHGNLVIALIFTRMETGRIGGNWYEVLRSFFAGTVSVLDVIYAFCAVAIAVFYSKRRLNRHEVLALRKGAAVKNEAR